MPETPAATLAGAVVLGAVLGTAACIGVAGVVPVAGAASAAVFFFVGISAFRSLDAAVLATAAGLGVDSGLKLEPDLALEAGFEFGLAAAPRRDATALLADVPEAVGLADTALAALAAPALLVASFAADARTAPDFAPALDLGVGVVVAGLARLAAAGAREAVLAARGDDVAVDLVLAAVAPPFEGFDREGFDEDGFDAETFDRGFPGEGFGEAVFDDRACDDTGFDAVPLLAVAGLRAVRALACALAVTPGAFLPRGAAAALTLGGMMTTPGGAASSPFAASSRRQA